MFIWDLDWIWDRVSLWSMVIFQHMFMHLADYRLGVCYFNSMTCLMNVGDNTETRAALILYLHGKFCNCYQGHKQDEFIPNSS